MQFAVGPTIVARRTALESIGGFERMKDYLAEDFVLGKFASEAGQGVILSSYVVEHHIGSSDFRHNAAHRLRWARSTRRSRPLGYLGQAFTMPLPWAMAVCAVNPAWWPVLLVTLAVRAAAAYMVSTRVLRVEAELGADAAGGSGGLRVLDRGIFRKHDRLARAALPAAFRRPVRIAHGNIDRFLWSRLGNGRVFVHYGVTVSTSEALTWSNSIGKLWPA